MFNWRICHQRAYIKSHSREYKTQYSTQLWVGDPSVTHTLNQNYPYRCIKPFYYLLWYYWRWRKKTWKKMLGRWNYFILGHTSKINFWSNHVCQIEEIKFYLTTTSQDFTPDISHYHQHCIPPTKNDIWCLKSSPTWSTKSQEYKLIPYEYINQRKAALDRIFKRKPTDQRISQVHGKRLENWSPIDNK